MVNNYIYFNKTNNHLSPQIFEHKKYHAYDVRNQVLAWDRHKNVAWLNRYLASPFHHWQLNLQRQYRYE
jgi:hypothetical protein